MLAAAAGLVWLVLWRTDKRAAPERIGFQDAAVPLGMPASGRPDHRFAFPSAWLTAQIPTAPRFDPPMGSEHGALTYNAQKFWEMNHKRGGRHLGDDFNGIGGMDTDLGDSLFSVADGLVVYTGDPSPGWGKIVILAHRTADGGIVHSMYSHLDRIDTARGALVPRGGKIGTVGNAGGNYPAHLHFEMRAGDGVDIGAGYGMKPLDRTDPTATLAALRNAPPADLAPAPLAAALATGDAPWTSLEIKGAERFSDLPGPPR